MVNVFVDGRDPCVIWREQQCVYVDARGERAQCGILLRRRRVRGRQSILHEVGEYRICVFISKAHAVPCDYRRKREYSQAAEQGQIEFQVQARHGQSCERANT